MALASGSARISSLTSEPTLHYFSAAMAHKPAVVRPQSADSRLSLHASQVKDMRSSLHGALVAVQEMAKRLRSKIQRKKFQYQTAWPRTRRDSIDHSTTWTWSRLHQQREHWTPWWISRRKPWSPERAFFSSRTQSMSRPPETPDPSNQRPRD
jgi:hypothetical protein